MGLKIQTHNLVAKTHAVKAGTFPVQIYQEHASGLYVERDFYGHPVHRHWQAHILPQLNLQVCRFTPRQGQPQWRYYIDTVQVEREGRLWRVRDLYLDVVILPDGKVQILDTDELFEAADAGLVTPQQLALATHAAHNLVNLLAQHENDLPRALASKNIVLNWDYSPSPTI
ncbi:MAG: RNA-binding protein [Meiothermus sp.]